MSIYKNLCDRGRSRVKNKNIYYEKHHIIPKCMNGDNSNDNITLLTAREHYVAHRLLCRVYHTASISIRAKLSSAFNRMCCRNKHKRFLTSRQYETARKIYSINHPMRDPKVREKVSRSHIERNKIIKEIRLKSMPFCECGCGQRVKNRYTKFIYNHWDRSAASKKGFTPQVKKRLSELAKKRISNLTEEQKRQRLEKTLHGSKIDHKKRGLNISLGKKDKKTKQTEIMGMRFAQMTDDEFIKYLNTVSKRVHTRFIKLRDKWKR